MKERIYEGFDKDNGFIKNNNFKLIELNKEVAKVEYIVNESGLNSIGIVHGGVLFGLADTTAGALACMSGKFPVTTTSNINYVKSVSKGKVTAIAKAIREGNLLGVYEVKIYDEKDNLLCVATIEMLYKNID